MVNGDRPHTLQFVSRFKFKLRQGHSRTLGVEAAPAAPWLAASPAHALPLCGCVRSAAGFLPEFFSPSDHSPLLANETSTRDIPSMPHSKGRCYPDVQGVIQM